MRSQRRGALGLIINKPLAMRMGEIFEQLEIELPDGPVRERPVLRGGPMQTDRGFVVHRAGGDWDSTLKVSDSIHVTTSRDILAAMARGEGPQEAIVALGLCRLGRRPARGRDPRERVVERAGRSRASFSTCRSNPAGWPPGELLGVELSRISAISGNA